MVPGSIINFGFFGKKLYFIILQKQIIIYSLKDNSDFSFSVQLLVNSFGYWNFSEVYELFNNLIIKLINKPYTKYLLSKLLSQINSSLYKLIFKIFKICP